jgi:hypothetical protein
VCKQQRQRRLLYMCDSVLCGIRFTNRLLLLLSPLLRQWTNTATLDDDDAWPFWWTLSLSLVPQCFHHMSVETGHPFLPSPDPSRTMMMRMASSWSLQLLLPWFRRHDYKNNTNPLGNARPPLLYHHRRLSSWEQVVVEQYKYMGIMSSVLRVAWVRMLYWRIILHHFWMLLLLLLLLLLMIRMIFVYPND